ncbi:MAG: T9SS type A sorting domain-containing protein [Cytophagales bacterium]|nr:T9SS type A sorting domain-containing protein [Cytophagales bacterium]
MSAQKIRCNHLIVSRFCIPKSAFPLPNWYKTPSCFCESEWYLKLWALWIWLIVVRKNPSGRLQIAGCILSGIGTSFSSKSKAYPNPAEDRFFIQFAEPLKISQIEVFTQIGQRVLLVLNPKTTQGKTEIELLFADNQLVIKKRQPLASGEWQLSSGLWPETDASGQAFLYVNI